MEIKKEIKIRASALTTGLRILAILISVSVVVSIFGQTPERDPVPIQARSENPEAAFPQKLLFVGNSFTYFNRGVDVHLEKLVRSAHPNRPVLVESFTAPNQTVRGHVRNPGLGKILRQEPWDVVVVQGASYEPVKVADLRNFGEYSAILAEEVRASGSEIVFFMTWAYRSRPSMIGALESGYVSTGEKLSALVVPVGLAWEEVRRDRPVAYLYSDDRHPSIYGTYLAACVFYAALYGESPLGIEYQAGLPEEDARFLQQKAWLTVRQFLVGNPENRSKETHARLDR